MGITTLSAREFNQDVGRAKRAAKQGPVYITDRGKAAHVLLSVEEYRKILRRDPSIAELLASPETADIADKDWLPVRSRASTLREVDFG